MADVQAAFAAAGCVNVRTVIQSGTVLFDAPARVPQAFRRRVQGALRPLLGTEPVIAYRSIDDLRRIVDAKPFGALVADRTVKLYVAFLTAKPTIAPRFPLRLPKEMLEALAIANGDVLIVSRRKPSGMYGFPANWIEKELGVAATARNWSTVTRIVALAGERKETAGTRNRAP